MNKAYSHALTVLLLIWAAGTQAQNQSTPSLIKYLTTDARAHSMQSATATKSSNNDGLALLDLDVVSGSHRGVDVVVSVNSNLDAIEDGNLVDCGDAERLCTLRAAIRFANNEVTAGETVRIEIPAGQYLLDLEGTGEDMAATGDLDLIRDVTISGAGTSTTVIDGNEIDRVFDIHGEANVIFEQLTVTGGKTVEFGFLGNGGGIRHSGFKAGAMELLQVSVENNQSNGNGGGIFSSADRLKIEESTVAGNNASDSGGGIYADPGEEPNALVVTRSTVSGNTTEGPGGGIFFASGPAVVESSTISGNISSGRGGGLHYSDTNATLLVRMSTILDNISQSNSDSPEGGGVFNVNHAEPVHFQGTIIAGNLRSGTLDNCGTTGNAEFMFLSQGHNLSDDNLPLDASCNLVAQSDLTQVDPLVGNLSQNGGPTLTHRPLAESPAIDAGPESCTPAVDQRGIARPVGDRCDIGAVEVRGGGSIFNDRFESL